MVLVYRPGMDHCRKLTIKRDNARRIFFQNRTILPWVNDNNDWLSNLNRNGKMNRLDGFIEKKKKNLKQSKTGFNHSDQCAI